MAIPDRYLKQGFTVELRPGRYYNPTTGAYGFTQTGAVRQGAGAGDTQPTVKIPFFKKEDYGTGGLGEVRDKAPEVTVTSRGGSREQATRSFTVLAEKSTGKPVEIIESGSTRNGYASSTRELTPEERASIGAGNLNRLQQFAKEGRASDVDYRLSRLPVTLGARAESEVLRATKARRDELEKGNFKLGRNYYDRATILDLGIPGSKPVSIPKGSYVTGVEESLPDGGTRRRVFVQSPPTKEQFKEGLLSSSGEQTEVGKQIQKARDKEAGIAEAKSEILGDPFNAFSATGQSVLFDPGALSVATINELTGRVLIPDGKSVADVVAERRAKQKEEFKGKDVVGRTVAFTGDLINEESLPRILAEGYIIGVGLGAGASILGAGASRLASGAGISKVVPKLTDARTGFNIAEELAMLGTKGVKVVGDNPLLRKGIEGGLLLGFPAYETYATYERTGKEGKVYSILDDKGNVVAQQNIPFTESERREIAGRAGAESLISLPGAIAGFRASPLKFQEVQIPYPSDVVGGTTGSRSVFKAITLGDTPVIGRTESGKFTFLRFPSFDETPSFLRFGEALVPLEQSGAVNRPYLPQSKFETEFLIRKDILKGLGLGEESVVGALDVPRGLDITKGVKTTFFSETFPKRTVHFDEDAVKAHLDFFERLGRQGKIERVRGSFVTQPQITEELRRLGKDYDPVFKVSRKEAEKLAEQFIKETPKKSLKGIELERDGIKVIGKDLKTGEKFTVVDTHIEGEVADDFVLGSSRPVGERGYGVDFNQAPVKLPKSAIPIAGTEEQFARKITASSGFFSEEGKPILDSGIRRLKDPADTYALGKSIIKSGQLPKSQADELDAILERLKTRSIKNPEGKKAFERLGEKEAREAIELDIPVSGTSASLFEGASLFNTGRTASAFAGEVAKSASSSRRERSSIYGDSGSLQSYLNSSGLSNYFSGGSASSSSRSSQSSSSKSGGSSFSGGSGSGFSGSGGSGYGSGSYFYGSDGSSGGGSSTGGGGDLFGSGGFWGLPGGGLGFAEETPSQGRKVSKRRFRFTGSLGGVFGFKGVKATSRELTGLEIREPDFKIKLPKFTSSRRKSKKR